VAFVPSVARAGQPVVSYGNLPLRFEANEGQTDPLVKFLARGHGYALFLTASDAVLVLDAPSSRPSWRDRASATGEQTLGAPAVVTMRLIGADPTARVVALDRLPGASHYLIGRDPQRWRRDVPGFARVRYDAVYPGISLVYYGNQRELEYDFVVAPGGDPETIVLELDGADALRLDERGDLVIATARGDVRLRRPVVYQEVDGARRVIDGGYTVEGGRRVRFRVASYDVSRPLVIDPVLAYSTYLGGGADDQAFGIAVDVDGNAYVTGSTISADFPVVGAAQGAKAGGKDVFVTKLDASGSNIVYSTYLGGSGDDRGNAIAVDATGNAYVGGQTTSLDFPTVNAFQTTRRSIDGFLSKLSPTGSTLVYSTLLGGSLDDVVLGVAVDGAGEAVVTGSTASIDFPTANALQAALRAGSDVFVTKFTASGSSLVYSTYLGGSGDDVGHGIVLDANGNAFIVGATTSTNFPTQLPSQPAKGGGLTDAFVAQLNFDPGTGLSLVFSTYLGGSAEDEGHAIALGPDGSVTVVGSTTSTNFPTARAIQPANGGTTDAFVTRLLFADGALTLVYSTYLGGTDVDGANGVAVHTDGSTHVVGTTRSLNFPVFNPLTGGGVLAGGSDLFVTKLVGDGSALVYSTYLGGAADDAGNAIALDADGLAYVAGSTKSTAFPTVAPAQGSLGGALDAIVAQIADGGILQFSEAAFTVVENAGPAIIRVTRTGDRSSAVTVNFATSDNTATAGSDYVATSGILSFAPGDIVQTFVVPITDDSVGEGDESFTVTLSAPTGGAILGARKTAPVTIIDDEASVNFSDTDFTVVEGGVATVTVVRTGPLVGTVVVGYATQDGTATGGAAAGPGVDYITTRGTLTFGPGVPTQTFTVTTVNDTVPEPTETVQLRLTSVTGGTPPAVLGARSTATLNITDNDPGGGFIEFAAATFSVNESAGVATITVKRTGGRTGGVTVQYATMDGVGTAQAGSDYISTSGTLTFAAGQLTKTFTIPIVNDRIDEADETVVLALSNAGGGGALGAQRTATLTIVDNDTAGVIQFSAPIFTVSEARTQAVVTVKRTGGLARGSGPTGILVDFATSDRTATAGSDYLAASGTLSFAAGETVKTFTVTLLPDTASEGNETFVVTLSNPRGGAILGRQRTALVKINDDEPTVQFSATTLSTAEGWPGVITVERTGPAGLPGTVTVRYAAAGGTAVPTTDYTPVAGTLTFGPGIAVRTFRVPTRTNAIPNPVRTVNLQLSNVTGGAVLGPQSSAVLNILDNDPAGQISWTSASYSAREGAGLTWVIVKRTGGVAAGVTFDFTTVDGTAHAGQHYVASSGTLTFGSGALTKNIPLQVRPQNTVETGPLTFTVVLSNPRPTGFPHGATLVAPSIATVTIADDDEGGVVQFATANVTVAENAQLCTPVPPANACARVTVKRSGGAASQAGADYSMADGTAVANVDYVPTNGRAMFAAGQTATTIPIQLIDNATTDGPRAFTITLRNPRGGATLGTTTTTTVHIADDE
jgi:hypothetical protein